MRLYFIQHGLFYPSITEFLKKKPHIHILNFKTEVCHFLRSVVCVISRYNFKFENINPMSRTSFHDVL